MDYIYIYVQIHDVSAWRRVTLPSVPAADNAGIKVLRFGCSISTISFSQTFPKEKEMFLFFSLNNKKNLGQSNFILIFAYILSIPSTSLCNTHIGLYYAI